jgi:hypothetical protein
VNGENERRKMADGYLWRARWTVRTDVERRVIERERGAEQSRGASFWPCFACVVYDGPITSSSRCPFFFHQTWGPVLFFEKKTCCSSVGNGDDPQHAATGREKVEQKEPIQATTRMASRIEGAGGTAEWLFPTWRWSESSWA